MTDDITREPSRAFRKAAVAESERSLILRFQLLFYHRFLLAHFGIRPSAARILRLMKIDERPYVVAIVDDDRRVLESLGELLESEGYAVRLFDSADAFLRADALQDIDALISDIRMPG